MPLAGCKDTSELIDDATGTTYTETYWYVGEDGQYWLSNHDTIDDFYGNEIMEDGSICSHEGPVPVLWYVWISIGDDEINAFYYDTYDGSAWFEIRGRSVRPVWVDK